MIKNFLVIIHKLLVYFMAIGFIVPEQFLFYFIITWPCVYLHWQFNHGRCILTEIEYYLDNKRFPPTVDKDHDYPFMKSMLSEINVQLSDHQIHYAIMYGFTASCLIGILRYVKYIYIK